MLTIYLVIAPIMGNSIDHKDNEIKFDIISRLMEYLYSSKVDG